MRKLIIDDELTIDINDDGVTTHCFDMEWLDESLSLIDDRLLDVELPNTDIEDLNAPWDTHLGKEIDVICQRIEEAEEL